MKTENINYPLDSIAIVHCLETLPGGVSLSVEDYEGTTIAVGTPIYKKDKKYYPLKGGRLYQDAAAASREIKLSKGGYVFKAGDEPAQGLKVKKLEASQRNMTSMSSRALSPPP